MQKKEFVLGVLFTAGAKYSNIVVSLVISAILARLLTPEDFGVITIATVILSFFAILCDLGIAPAIVQNKELTKDDINNVFSFTGYLGVFVSLCFILISPIITKFYDVSSLLNICRLLSINLLFASLNIVPNSLLLKAKRFKFIAVRTVAVHAILGIIAVVSALSGLGMYSLLIAPIGSSIAIFVINIIQYPLLFRAKIQKSSIKKISSYSTYQFLFSTINYFARNLDNILIGKYIGVTDLGYYDKSYRLMLLPLSNITHVITPVLHPLLSEHQNDKTYIFSSYLKLLKLLSYIGFPLSVFLFFQASNLILFVFGDQWMQSVPIFKVLAISVAPQILCSTSGSIFQSVNETKRLFVVGCISTTVSILAIVLSIIFFRDVVYVAMFVCFAYYFHIIFAFWYMFKYLFSQSMLPFIKILTRPILLALCLIPVCLFLTRIKIEPIISIFTTFLICLIIILLWMQISRDFDIMKTVKNIYGNVRKK